MDGDLIYKHKKHLDAIRMDQGDKTRGNNFIIKV